MKIDRTIMPYLSKEELKEFLESLTGIEKKSLLEVLKADDDIVNSLDGERKKFCEKAEGRVDRINNLMSDIEDEVRELESEVEKYQNQTEE